MASSSTQGRSLTEEDVSFASQQYDVTLVYHISLPRQGFCRIQPHAFARCQSLQLLDLSGNKLINLTGLEPIAAQLTFLNVSENKLADISALARCAQLRYCYLEGNELASVDALQPLFSLPQLSDLVLQRTVSLAGTDPQEALLLDNPVCRNVEIYQQQVLTQMQQILWVDGIPTFARKKLLTHLGCDNNDDGGAGKDTTNDALLNSADAAHEAALLEMMRHNVEESTLRRLLADAAKKCSHAEHP